MACLQRLSSSAIMSKKVAVTLSAIIEKAITCRSAKLTATFTLIIADDDSLCKQAIKGLLLAVFPSWICQCRCFYQ